MDINEIVNSCQYENENAKIDFERWVKAITPLFDKKDIKRTLVDKQQLCKMFYRQKSGRISQQSYDNNRKHIETLQRFYNISPAVPSREDVLKSQEIVYLYKNLESLLEFIDKVGESIFPNYDTSDDLLNVKAIAILGWHGFSLAEVASLQKDSLYDCDNFNSVNKIQINMKFFNILKRLAAAEEYNGLPSGRLQKYKSDDKYLFRSIIKDQLVTENHLADILKRFNRIAEAFFGAIVFRNLRDNALFVEIAKDKTTKKLSEKIKEAFRCDIKTAYGLEKEFNQWQESIFLS